MIWFPYQEKVKDFNLLYMLYLYDMAEYDRETKCRDKIVFSTRKKLTEDINAKYNISLSASTIERLIKNADSYSFYYKIDFSKSQIRLQNDFQKKKQVRFITLSDKAFKALIAQKNDLLIKYYCYLCYNCGKSSTKSIDHTAELILSNMGYCGTSNKNKSLLYDFNSLLTKLELITISKKTDEQGHTRNIYKIL